jgi:L-alanine-DL-glutamate epimerase-like enolase superfamily enzyme
VGKSMAKVLLGQDPFELPRIIAAMDVFTSGHPTIKAAFEMAVWDICGKIAGQPVCHLLGQYRDSFETDRTVFLDTPEIMARKAKAIADEGFKVVKIKLGQAPEYDIERLRAVRAAVGNITRLRIDANQGWPPAAAVRALRGLERFNVEFCEQPGIETDWEGLKYVRNHSPIPIMADECVHSPVDAIRLVRLDAADMINIKLMKTGGILNAARIADIADAANMKCMLGCMSETRLGLTAAAHVVAAKRCVAYADLDAFTEHKDDPVVGGMRLKDGVLFVPDTPGLGLDMDPAFMKTLRAA